MAITVKRIMENKTESFALREKMRFFIFDDIFVNLNKKEKSKLQNGLHLPRTNEIYQHNIIK